MADIMLKDLETDKQLDYKALAKLIGGHYGDGGGYYGKKQFSHYCAHHWHFHNRGYASYGHFNKYRKKAYSYYKEHYQEWY